MRTACPQRLVLLALGASLLLAGCGGSSSGGGGGFSTSTQTVGGRVVAAPVAGSRVRVYQVGPAPALALALVAEATTDAEGRYELEVSGAGPFLLLADGGDYEDEATGQGKQVAPAGEPASLASLPAGGLFAVGYQAPLMITPLTTIAAQRVAQLAQEGPLDAARVNAVHSELGRELGLLSDPRAVEAAELTVPGASVNVGGRAGALLSGLSQLASDRQVSDPLTLVHALASDFADGVFDGQRAGAAVAGIDANTARGELARSTRTFLEGPRNRSGIAASGWGELLEAIARQDLAPDGVNRAPSFRLPADVRVTLGSGPQEVLIEGLSAGEAGQTLQLSVLHQSGAQLDLLQISELSATTARVSFEPREVGTAVVQVTVRDDGGIAEGGQDSFSYAFEVRVDPAASTPSPSSPSGCLVPITSIVAIEQTAAGQPLQWKIDSFGTVPLTDLDTPNHTIQLELKADDLQARLVKDGNPWFTCATRALPVQVVELPGGRFFVAQRRLLGDVLTFLDVDAGGASRAVTLPSELEPAIFRLAVLHDDELLVVLSNVNSPGDSLYRWRLVAGELEYDATFKHPLAFREIADRVPAVVHNGVLYFGCDDALYSYSAGNLRRLTTPQFEFRLLEIARDPALGVVALAQRWESGGRGYFLFDMVNESTLWDRPITDLLHSVSASNGQWVAQTPDTAEKLASVLRDDLRTRSIGGLGWLGTTNSEGRIGWSEVYFVNGCIDLLTRWGSEPSPPPTLVTLRRELKLRLDLHVYLIDRLLAPGEQRLLARRYSGDRSQVNYITQSARTVRMLRRYRSRAHAPLPLPRLAALEAETLNVTGFLEELATGVAGDQGVQPGERWLRNRKGSIHRYDGANVPWNHQSAWAGALCWEAAPAAELVPAREMLLNFVRLEQPFQRGVRWHYNWGWMRAGWGAGDALSTNTPSYGGDGSLAHVSYQAMDVMGLLSVAKVYPSVLPSGFLDFLADEVAAGRMRLFILEEMARHGVLPCVPREVAAQSFRQVRHNQLQRSAWAFLRLWGAID